MATIDEERNVYIVDRKKDIIKSGGEWISTQTLESILSEHAKVSECAVIGVPHEKWEERPVAVIVPTDDTRKKISDEELKEHLKKYIEEGKIRKWWIPDKFIFREELPKTSVGKIDKKELRPEYGNILTD